MATRGSEQALIRAQNPTPLRQFYVKFSLFWTLFLPIVWCIPLSGPLVNWLQKSSARRCHFTFIYPITRHGPRQTQWSPFSATLDTSFQMVQLSEQWSVMGRENTPAHLSLTAHVRSTFSTFGTVYTALLNCVVMYNLQTFDHRFCKSILLKFY